MKTLGIGIQGVETALREVFKEKNITRIDSDRQRDEKIHEAEIESAQIVLGTELANLYTLGSFGLVAFLLIEAEMTVPEYDIEEHIYTHAVYHRTRGADIVLQTHLPDSPLVRDLADRAFRDFFLRTLGERRQYGYPPYGELVYVWVRDRSLDRVHDIIHRLVNKLTIARAELGHEKDVQIFFDRIYSIRQADDHIQKIVLK